MVSFIELHLQASLATTTRNRMKKVTCLLLSVMLLLSSCIGLRNTVNRSLVKEGEPYVKYGVYGFPDGIEVVKGHECMLTDREIRKRDRKFEKAQKKR